MRKSAKSIALILAVVMIIAMFPLTASAASNKPGKVKISSFSVSKASASTNMATVKIKWKKVSKATGYWVYYRGADGNWTVFKKLGKKYGGITITDVPAGQRAFKVRAVRKVKKKTYKGSFSITKSKFIKSPLDFEKFLKLEGEQTEYNEPLDDTGASLLAVTTKGNNMKMAYCITGDASAKPDANTINSFFAGIEENKADLINICKSARLEGGIKGVTVTVALSFNGEELESRTYSE